MTRKLVAVVFAFSFCIGLCQRCEVTVAYPKVVGFTRYTSILNCSYTNCPYPLYVVWYNGTQSDGDIILTKMNDNPVDVRSPYMGRFSLVGQADLQIDNVRKEDENIYTCWAYPIFSGGDIKTTMFDVEETVPPDIIDISVVEIPIVDGQDVSVTCSATGTQLTFEWRRGERLVYETERYSFNDDGSRLFINDVNRSDAGNLTCVAGNIIGTATMTVFIDVYYEPDQPNCSHSNPKTPYEGDTISIVCGSADGNPRATLRWVNTAMDTLKETAPPYTGGTAVNEYSWTVSRTNNEETFRCEATNQVQAQPLHCSTGNLRVFFASRNVSLTGNDGPLIRGDRMVLTCETASSNPASEITWFRNNTEISSSDQERTGDELIKDSSFHGFATLQNLTVNLSPEHNGIRYYCAAYFASDEISANSSVAVINVIFPPEQPESCHTRITGYSDYYLEGDNLDLSCISCSANPAVDIEWFRNGADPTSGIGETEITAGHFNGYVSTLHLRDNISATDHGTKYRCIASSETYFPDEEYPSQVYRLNVHFPPDQPKQCKTSITGYSDYVMEGELLELRCISCSANPTANVEWFRNDVRVTLGISEREITDGDYNGYISTVSLTENITATDHGSKFRCVVSSKTYFPDKDYPSQVLKLNVHCK